jgi:hypothetical protein
MPSRRHARLASSAFKQKILSGHRRHQTLVDVRVQRLLADASVCGPAMTLHMLDCSIWAVVQVPDQRRQGLKQYSVMPYLVIRALGAVHASCIVLCMLCIVFPSLEWIFLLDMLDPSALQLPSDRAFALLKHLCKNPSIPDPLLVVHPLKLKPLIEGEMCSHAYVRCDTLESSHGGPLCLV